MLKLQRQSVCLSGVSKRGWLLFLILQPLANWTGGGDGGCVSVSVSVSVRVCGCVGVCGCVRDARDGEFVSLFNSLTHTYGTAQAAELHQWRHHYISLVIW